VILAKTEKGRASLSDRRAFVRRERQLLVLADGRRDKDELAGLLGGDLEELVTRMVFDGYLVRVAPSARDTAGSDHTAARAARPVSGRESAGAGPDIEFGPCRIAGTVVPVRRLARAGCERWRCRFGCCQCNRCAKAAPLAGGQQDVRDRPDADVA